MNTEPRGTKIWSDQRLMEVRSNTDLKEEWASLLCWARIFALS